MWQITQRLIADVSFGNGDAYGYVITDEQLEDAKQKMRHGLGSLEWKPRYGATPGHTEIINVRAVDRIRPWYENVLQDALVQLWWRPQTRTLYIGDPDDGKHLVRLDGLANPGQFRPNFTSEAADLVAGEINAEDLGAVVGAPSPADVLDMTLAAEYRHVGGVHLLVDPDTLDDVARAYLGNNVITDYREVQAAKALELEANRNGHAVTRG